MSPPQQPAARTIRLHVHGQARRIHPFRRPGRALLWRLAQLAVVAGLCALTVALWIRPQPALQLFWGLAIPLLPLIFMATPGVWRNVCPMASANQLPRLLGISKGLRSEMLSWGGAYGVSVVLFLAFIVGRKLVLNGNGPATALMIVAAMGSALLGGLLFKGKSGWCGTLCPLAPIQRVYGQTPRFRVETAHCKPCVGCLTNCYDLHPEHSYLVDQYDGSRSHREVRKLFVALLPGFVLGYYLVPNAPQISTQSLLGHMALYAGGSLAIFTLIDCTAGALRNVVPMTFGLVAITIFYWYASPLIIGTLRDFGLPVPPGASIALKTIVAMVGARWWWQSIGSERSFLREQFSRIKEGEVAPLPVIVETIREHRAAIGAMGAMGAVTDDAAAAAGVDEPSAAHPASAAIAVPVPAPAGAAATIADRSESDTHEIKRSPSAGASLAAIAPAGAPAAAAPGHVVKPITLVPRIGQTLLEAIEGGNHPIESGCRMGLCGADPIHVVDGAGCLNKAGSAEQATLKRLDCAPGMRLACMARVVASGPVAVRMPGLESEDLAASGAAMPAAAGAAVTTDAGETVTAATLPRAGTQADAAPARRYVIVGNGIAGTSTAHALRRLDSHCEIVLIGDEAHAPYNRMSVAHLIGNGAAPTSLTLHPPSWYQRHRIDRRDSCRVRAIDADQHSVLMSNGESITYERLVLATGARPNVPAFANQAAEGVFVLRTIDDAQRLRSHMAEHPAPSCVVVGAGVLGVEAAYELQKAGGLVTLLARGERVMDRIADARASRLVIDALSRRGVVVRTMTEVTSALTDVHGSLRALRLEDGSEIVADVAVVCAGVTPSIDLARQIGVEVDRGIVVDAAMRTSLPDVFAVGDVAQFEGRCTGLWADAIAQADVAAASILERPASYVPPSPVTRLKFPGIDFVALGHSASADPAADESACIGAPTNPGSYRKLLTRSGCAVGAILLDSADDVETIAATIESGVDLTLIAPQLRAGQWDALKDCLENNRAAVS